MVQNNIPLRVIDENFHLKRKDGSNVLIFQKSVAPLMPSSLKSQLKKHCLSRGGKASTNNSFKENKKESFARSRRSKLIGYYDISRDYKEVKIVGTNKYYRPTEYTKNYKQTEEHDQYWNKLSDTYKQVSPEEFKKQEDYFPLPYRIAESVFTTATCNLNWESPIHQDKGNLRGCMTLFTVVGSFEGALLVFPDWNIGIKVKEGDILLFDGHERHGNTELLSGERLSLCCYVRENLTKYKTRKIIGEKEFYL